AEGRDGVRLVGRTVRCHGSAVEAQRPPPLGIDDEDAERPTAGKPLAQGIGVRELRGEAQRPGARGRDDTGRAGDERGPYAPRGVDAGEDGDALRCQEWPRRVRDRARDAPTEMPGLVRDSGPRLDGALARMELV